MSLFQEMNEWFGKFGHVNQVIVLLKQSRKTVTQIINKLYPKNKNINKDDLT